MAGLSNGRAYRQAGGQMGTRRKTQGTHVASIIAIAAILVLLAVVSSFPGHLSLPQQLER